MLTPLHDWNLAPREARALQSQLAERLEISDRLAPVSHIAGVDIGFEDGGETTRAAVVVLKWSPATAPYLSVVEQVVYREPTRMPYIPGLLSFREVPAALGAFAMLSVQLDLPTIGIAKSRLCGKHAEVGEQRGDWVPLYTGAETIGAAVRSRAKVKPVYVSPGHRVTLDTSLAWVMRCLGRTKLPEPTRLADRLASRRDERKS